MGYSHPGGAVSCLWRRADLVPDHGDSVMGLVRPARESSPRTSQISLSSLA